MQLIRGASRNPLFEHIFLLLAQGLGGRGRRHHFVTVGGVDPGNELAGFDVARCDRAGFDGRLALVEAQVGFASGAIGPVAREAVFGEDGANVAVVLEGDAIGRGCGGGPERERHDQKQRPAQELAQQGRTPEPPVIRLAHQPVLL